MATSQQPGAALRGGHRFYVASMAGIAKGGVTPVTEAEKKGCVDAAAGPLVEQSEQGSSSGPAPAGYPLARVGKEAPDFELIAFHQGEFKKVKLSDYRGKWVVLCFYPADFTFV